MNSDIETKSSTLKSRIPAVLVGWDVLTLVLVLALVGILFQGLLHPLMIDSAFTDLEDRHRRIESRYLQGLSYLEEKKLIPYDEGSEILLEVLAEQAGGELLTERSLAYISLLFRLPDGMNLVKIGTTENGRIRFRSVDTGESESGFEELQAVFGNGPVIVRLTADGVPMIGTLSLFSEGLRKDLKRSSNERVSPMLLMADLEEDFFSRINRIRILFYLMLGIVLCALLIIKLRVTNKVAGELRTIGNEILAHSEALTRTGRVSKRLNDLSLRFQDTHQLYGSFGSLNAGLERVGKVLGGIADPDLYVATLKDDSSLLDPHEVGMAVLYLDVEGFTTISEAYKARAMTIVNRMWNTVETAVYAHGGKLNKFIGDACIAIFMEEGDSACRRALHAAINVLSSVEGLRKELDIVFSFRIGIDYGTVTYGKTGSENNYELGVIGDPVNTAARLEEINKQYGTKILLSQEVVEGTGYDPSEELPVGQARRLRFFQVDYARPKGKREAKSFYTIQEIREVGITLLGDTVRLPEKYYAAFAILSARFREGVVLWREGARSEASGLWKKLARRFGELYAGYGFKPALPYLGSLLTPEELLKFEEDPQTWLKKPSIHVQPPSDEWVEIGARELGK